MPNKIEMCAVTDVDTSATNKHRVPLKMWKKWSAAARRVFNEVFSSMNNNQYVFLHPKQDLLSAQKWKTVAWNAAWIAADAVDGR